MLVLYNVLGIIYPTDNKLEEISYNRGTVQPWDKWERSQHEHQKKKIEIKFILEGELLGSPTYFKGRKLLHKTFE